VPEPRNVNWNGILLRLPTVEPERSRERLLAE
jgi:hypothetical protein